MVGFESFDLRPELLQAVTDAQFTEPRPIQAQTLPPALAGRDVLGLAQTGTGKTAAFVLPILQRLLAGKRSTSGPRALVVTPTRELASQVQGDFERLAKHTRLTSTCVFGGVPVARQVRALRRGPDIVVACPGRLLDLMGSGSMSLRGVEVLVLDEADHMFDMGFLPDLKRILKALPSRRQNLLFSATMPPAIRKLADNVLCKPAVVELANARPADTIEHALYPLKENEKLGALGHLLGGSDFHSAIVFVRTKRRAKQISLKLSSRGHSSVAMQGNMTQGQRERALRGFREGRYQVLVATDIAARGLDIAGISHVVNYDVPNTPDAYTHRIGRTGRSEQTGKAYTFITADDAAALRAIERRLGTKIERRRLSAQGELEVEAPARSNSRGNSKSSGRPRRNGNQARPARSRSSKAPVKLAPVRRSATPTRSKQEPVATPAASAPAFGVGVLDTVRPNHSSTSSDSGRRRRRRRA